MKKAIILLDLLFSFTQNKQFPIINTHSWFPAVFPTDDLKFSKQLSIATWKNEEAFGFIFLNPSLSY